MALSTNDDVRAVEVTLAGGLTILSAGVVLDGSDLRSRRAEVAFARLALDAGRRVTREDLADAIWGARRPASWESALRNVIVAVRRWIEASGLDGVVLSTSSDGYCLELPAGSSVDLATLGGLAAEAEKLLRHGDQAGALQVAERVLTVCARSVMAAVDGDWIEGLRSDLAEMSARMRRVEGLAAMALGDLARVEQAALALISTEPLREDGHRMLMNALAVAGNRGAALAAYDACRRLLSDELGVMPSPETQALFSKILAEDQAEQAVPVQGSWPEASTGRRRGAAAGPLLLVHRQTPVVGHAALLDRLTAQLNQARDAGPLTVCMTGEAGLGKTRLAAELAARAHGFGMTVLYGRAEDRISLPYGSLLEAMHGALAGLDPREVAQGLEQHAGVIAGLLPGLVPPAGPLGPTALGDLGRLHVEQAFVAALRFLGSETGALLVLDDMQWASRLELGVVAALAMESRRLPLMILILHRGNTGKPELEDLITQQRGMRIALEPLTPHEISELARLSGIRGTPAAQERLGNDTWRMSGGNPLLASELLLSWREDRQRERPTPDRRTGAGAPCAASRGRSGCAQRSRSRRARV